MTLLRQGVMAWPWCGSVHNRLEASMMEEALRDSLHLDLWRIWLAICPHPVVWGCQSCTPPQGQTPWCPAPGKGREPMWADQPAQSLPAPICWAARHLSSGRFEWGWPVSHHQFAGTIAQWLQCHYQWISICKDYHSFPYPWGAGLCDSAC